MRHAHTSNTHVHTETLAHCPNPFLSWIPLLYRIIKSFTRHQNVASATARIFYRFHGHCVHMECKLSSFLPSHCKRVSIYSPLMLFTFLIQALISNLILPCFSLQHSRNRFLFSKEINM